MSTLESVIKSKNLKIENFEYWDKVALRAHAFLTILVVKIIGWLELVQTKYLE